MLDGHVKLLSSSGPPSETSSISNIMDVKEAGEGNEMNSVEFLLRGGEQGDEGGESGGEFVASTHGGDVVLFGKGIVASFPVWISKTEKAPGLSLAGEGGGDGRR